LVIGGARAYRDRTGGVAPTADLLTQRMQVHEKSAWMLRSMAS